MIARHLLLIAAGFGCLLWGAWLGFPLARAMAAGAVANGRIIDVRVVPAGDGLMRVTALFEYPAPEDPRTYRQGSCQVDARLRPTDDPLLPIAEAVALRQRLLDHPHRRIFLSLAPAPADAGMMTDAASHGADLRQMMPLLIGIGILLVSFGLRFSAGTSRVHA